MNFKNYSEAHNGKLLVANIPNNLYFGVDTGNGIFRLVEPTTAGAKNISVVYLSDDRDFWRHYSRNGEVAECYLTGRYNDFQDRTVWQVLFPAPVVHSGNGVAYYSGHIDIYKGSKAVNAWHTAEPGGLGAKLSTFRSDLGDILNRHRLIQSNNIFCSEIVSELDRLGISYPKNKIEGIVKLQSYIETFDEALQRVIPQGSSVVKYDDLDGSKLKSLVLSYQNSVGLVWNATTIIIAVSLLASFTTAIWLLVQKFNPQSKVALKYSNELTADLIKYLPKDVYNRLIKENNRFERIANNAIANTAGLGTIKTLGLGLIALFVGKYIVENYNVDKKNTSNGNDE